MEILNKADSPKKRIDFPEGFLWGTATSAYQVEGNNVNSDWWKWEQELPEREKSGNACCQYSLFKEDFNLTEKLNNNAHRFSIEWSRLEPSEGFFDRKEIKHYQEVLKELKSKSLTTFVTLYHFTLPFWFSKKGGFSKRENVFFFERFVKLCAEEFSQFIDYWITINEPNVYVLLSYITGDWPPQKKSYLQALVVFSNLAFAHKKAYQILHQKLGNPKVGAAVHFVSYQAGSRYIIFNRVLRWFMDFCTNRSFYLLTGKTHDFIGVNYYLECIIPRWRLGPNVGVKDLRKIMQGEQRKGWGHSASGLYKILASLAHFSLPIFITENGTACINDVQRVNFLTDHLESLHKALSNRIDIAGYFYWSLIDNYEWTLGFRLGFGLVAINHETQKREPKPSFYHYAKICQQNGFSV